LFLFFLDSPLILARHTNTAELIKNAAQTLISDSKQNQKMVGDVFCKRKKNDGDMHAPLFQNACRAFTTTGLITAQIMSRQANLTPLPMTARTFCAQSTSRFFSNAGLLPLTAGLRLFASEGVHPSSGWH